MATVTVFVEAVARALALAGSHADNFRSRKFKSRHVVVMGKLALVACCRKALEILQSGNVTDCEISGCIKDMVAKKSIQLARRQKFVVDDVILVLRELEVCQHDMFE